VHLPQGTSYPQGAAQKAEVLLEVGQHGVPAPEGVQLELTVETVTVLGQGHPVLAGLDGEAVDHLADECFHKREGLDSQVIRAVHQEHHICILRSWPCPIKKKKLLFSLYILYPSTPLGPIFSSARIPTKVSSESPTEETVKQEDFSEVSQQIFLSQLYARGN
jgi:hypothetical protein